MFIDFKGRKGERQNERNVNVREKHQLVTSHRCPDQGLNLQPRYVPLPGIKSPAFLFMGRCSNQLSHTGQGHTILFLSLGSID